MCRPVSEDPHRRQRNYHDCNSRRTLFQNALNIFSLPLYQTFHLTQLHLATLPFTRGTKKHMMSQSLLVHFQAPKIQTQGCFILPDLDVPAKHFPGVLNFITQDLPKDALSNDPLPMAARAFLTQASQRPTVSVLTFSEEIRKDRERNYHVYDQNQLRHCT